MMLSLYANVRRPMPRGQFAATGEGHLTWCPKDSGSTWGG
jgi:hypothetical protein